VKPNQYPARCWVCKERVPAGAGLVMGCGPPWQVTHKQRNRLPGEPVEQWFFSGCPVPFDPARFRRRRRRKSRDVPARGRRAYIAHPMVTYGTARERDCLAALHRLLPDVYLYDPAPRYSTDTAWLRAWPRVVPTLSGLVLFGTRDGVVGVGCLKELSEAQRAGVPVAMLDHRCRPRGYGGLALPARAPTTRRAAVLLPGEPVDLGELFGLPTTKGAE